jgi:hypothetical protein
MAQAPKTFMERMFPSTGAAEINATTPKSEVRTSPAFAAPTVPVSREARTPLGIYSNPSRYDVMSQFGYRKQLDTASVISQSSSPAVPAASTPQQTTVTAMPHVHNTPGPAPDMTSMQMNQIRNQMQMMTPQAPPQNVMPTIQNPSPVTQVLNHDHTMNMIQNPADTPSAYRAFARAYGNETPGTFGEGHFNYGNAR